ncbi:MAG: LCP family protein [Clostridia bacterium]|nr:LCP family protein [Clostridia bacterium]
MNNQQNNRLKYSKNIRHRDTMYDDDYDSKNDIQTFTAFNNDDDEFEYNKTDYPFQKHSRKNYNIKKIILIILGSVLALILFVVLIGWLISFTIPAKTHVLLMATDEDGTRTDTIMLATFDKNSKDISIVSIPRDTFITVSDDTFKKMCQDYPEPGSKSMKINAVHHYGNKYGVELLQKEVEKLFDIKLDYYIKIDFDAFKYIIDSVGGIDFYVPQDMEYHDPYQNLHIVLKEGQQHLDGDEAEQLVRYRSGYANGDLGRVDVQQQFMKAFISQVFSKNTILSHPGVFLDVLFKYDYVETNAGYFDCLSYLFVINGIDTKNIQTATLPGSSGYTNGQSVYFVDDIAVDELVESMVK